jgi:hypothetical protein
MDQFTALLSDVYHEEKWVGREIGFIDLSIIPVTLGKYPYGRKVSRVVTSGK